MYGSDHQPGYPGRSLDGTCPRSADACSGTTTGVTVQNGDGKYPRSPDACCTITNRFKKEAKYDSLKNTKDILQQRMGSQKQKMKHSFDTQTYSATHQMEYQERGAR